MIFQLIDLESFETREVHFRMLIFGIPVSIMALFSICHCNISVSHCRSEREMHQNINTDYNIMLE